MFSYLIKIVFSVRVHYFSACDWPKNNINIPEMLLSGFCIRTVNYLTAVSFRHSYILNQYIMPGLFVNHYFNELHSENKAIEIISDTSRVLCSIYKMRLSVLLPILILLTSNNLS